MTAELSDSLSDLLEGADASLQAEVTSPLSDVVTSDDDVSDLLEGVPMTSDVMSALDHFSVSNDDDETLIATEGTELDQTLTGARLPGEAEKRRLSIDGDGAESADRLQKRARTDCETHDANANK